MLDDFVFHDGAYLNKEVLVDMAKRAGSFIFAEHYINSLLLHALVYKQDNIIDDVNKIREHYQVAPYPNMQAIVASNSKRHQSKNGLPSLDEQAREHYIRLDAKARRMLLKECLQLLRKKHPDLFQLKTQWMGVYMVVHDRLERTISKTGFYVFAQEITPEDWPEELKISQSTFNNFGRYVKYADRHEAYFDMNENPWKMLCDTLWNITRNRLLTENRRKD
jgi:hypothetical protein